MPATLLLLWLTARCAHLLQAGIDITTDSQAYRHLVLAVWLAAACAGESALVATAMVRARQLTLGALVCDAAFGVAGLIVMSAALGETASRAGSLNWLGSLNWMLPYTVGTATGLGLLAVGYKAEDARRREWRPPQLAMWQAGTVAALVAAFLMSMPGSQRSQSGGLLQPLADTANYVEWFAVALAVALLLRRWVRLIGERNAEVMHQAAELSRAVHWREHAAELFGSALEFFERLALIGDQVPEPMRAEAAGLIRRIEDVGARLRLAEADTAGAN